MEPRSQGVLELNDFCFPIWQAAIWFGRIYIDPKLQIAPTKNHRLFSRSELCLYHPVSQSQMHAQHIRGCHIPLCWTIDGKNDWFITSLRPTASLIFHCHFGVFCRVLPLLGPVASSGYVRILRPYGKGESWEGVRIPMCAYLEDHLIIPGLVS